MEVMITFFIEVVKLPNFGHVTTFSILFDSSNKTLLVASRAKLKTS